jgi:SnoaL-like polyketide cyclase
MHRVRSRPRRRIRDGDVGLPNISTASQPFFGIVTLVPGLRRGRSSPRGFPLESPTGTIAPTYKKVVGYGVQLLRVENGKIAEARIYFDQLDQMRQLGLIPTPATV